MGVIKCIDNAAVKEYEDQVCPKLQTLFSLIKTVLAFQANVPNVFHSPSDQQKYTLKNWWFSFVPPHAAV